MAKIYLPVEINNQCVEIKENHIFRVYSSAPNGSQQNVNYTDYFIDFNYITNTGTETFTQDTTINCLNNEQFTTDYWYRLDIWQSLLCFLIIGLITLYLPYKIISRMLGRWLKI